MPGTMLILTAVNSKRKIFLVLNFTVLQVTVRLKQLDGVDVGNILTAVGQRFSRRADRHLSAERADVGAGPRG